MHTRISMVKLRTRQARAVLQPAHRRSAAVNPPSMARIIQRSEFRADDPHQQRRTAQERSDRADEDRLVQLQTERAARFIVGGRSMLGMGRLAGSDSLAAAPMEMLQIVQILNATGSQSGKANSQQQRDLASHQFTGYTTAARSQCRCWSYPTTGRRHRRCWSPLWAMLQGVPLGPAFRPMAGKAP